MSSAKEIGAQQFDSEVLGAPGPVLVDFWAPWCGPCRALGPHVDRISQKYAGRVSVVKMNVDLAPVYRDRYGLMGVPALLLFNGGEVVDKVFGAYPAKVEAMIDKLLASAPASSEAWTPPPPPFAGTASGGGSTSAPVLPPIDQLVRRRNG